ncbi:peptidase inhibitor family I36 protein [Allokutzneria sp. NRRL B-24872]|uniref:peptidase inhibitor family I36 protein n=1 Tax=Allokutzneria sp. NRRL B-24872 TaxID=1137961 RepID=UPI000A3C356F|nr:peptidase inhibitor family I36 protein [Allokutzneria sp. NRRL B-24872]
MSRTAFALALAAAAAVVLPSTANADVQCPAGHVCMWEHENYGGYRYFYFDPAPGTTYYEIGGWDGDNEITSVQNLTNCTVSLFDNDLDTSGTSWDIRPETKIPHLGSIGANDRAESFATRCP